jgi:hypothetical protein
MEVFGSHSPIARKEHKCDLCRGAIKIGEKYDRWACADGGRAESIKVHQDCHSILKDCLDGDTEFDWWGVVDYVRETCRDNNLCADNTPLPEMAKIVYEFNRRS